MASQAYRLVQGKMRSSARGSFDFRAQSLFMYPNTFAVVNISSSPCSSMRKKRGLNLKVWGKVAVNFSAVSVTTCIKMSNTQIFNKCVFLTCIGFGHLLG